MLRLLHGIIAPKNYVNYEIFAPLLKASFSIVVFWFIVSVFVCFSSGNHMGDEGARILAKALQINSKLR